jgi:hypothetical protein
MEPAPFFCDHNPEYMRELQRRLGAVRDKSVLLQGDNQEAIEVFAECIRRAERPKYAIGSILIDPNGYFYRNQAGDGAPVDAVKWFSREFPRIDLILNLNIRTYQMQTAHGHAVEAPREVLRSLNKAHWLVGQTHTAGRRFLLAIGRNMPTGDHRALGLYRLESPQGQWIMNLAEGKRQHELPELPRISAPPGLFGSPSGGHAPDQRPVPDLRRTSNGSAPHPVPAVGDVRRAIEHEAALPPLPLFGAREG